MFDGVTSRWTISAARPSASRARVRVVEAERDLLRDVRRDERRYGAAGAAAQRAHDGRQIARRAGTPWP